MIGAARRRARRPSASATLAPADLCRSQRTSYRRNAGVAAASEPLVERRSAQSADAGVRRGGRPQAELEICTSRRRPFGSARSSAQRRAVRRIAPGRGSRGHRPVGALWRAGSASRGSGSAARPCTPRRGALEPRHRPALGRQPRRGERRGTLSGTTSRTLRASAASREAGAAPDVGDRHAARFGRPVAGGARCRRVIRRRPGRTSARPLQHAFEIEVSEAVARIDVQDLAQETDGLLMSVQLAGALRELEQHRDLVRPRPRSGRRSSTSCSVLKSSRRSSTISRAASRFASSGAASRASLYASAAPSRSSRRPRRSSPTRVHSLARCCGSSAKRACSASAPQSSTTCPVAA